MTLFAGPSQMPPRHEQGLAAMKIRGDEFFRYLTEPVHPEKCLYDLYAGLVEWKSSFNMNEKRDARFIVELRLGDLYFKGTGWLKKQF